MSPLERSIRENGALLRARRLTSEELTQEALDRIVAHDQTIHAFVLVDREAALASARQADRELMRGMNRGPLHGIPYGLKDIFDVEGLPTTCCSRAKTDAPARSDSTVAARLRRGGAVLLGKLTTFEFAIGGPSPDLAWPLARNPWNAARQTGGSSSGSAAAIAAGFTRLAIGSCTAGSIRGPAAWCGTVGLKPTFGLVSRYGVYPLSPSLDHCGPLSRSVEDAALALEVMAGYDPRDPDSCDKPTQQYTADLESGVDGLRIGVPRSFYEEHPSLSEDARMGLACTLAALEQRGASIRTVALPDFEIFLACVRVLMGREMYEIHRTHLRDNLNKLGALTTIRSLAGLAVEGRDYEKACKLQRWLRAQMNEALSDLDGMVTAISLSTAPPAEGPVRPLGWPLQASPFNLTGHPAMTVPVGLGRDGMPLAVQVVGRQFDEAAVLRIGRAVERASGWDKVPLPAQA